MKRVYTFALFSFFLVSNSLAQTPEKVLFIGNSLTYFNDMPTTFGDISNSLGKNVTVTMYAPGGTGFVNHVDDPNLYNMIRNDTFDIVVMQPGTSESGGTSYPISTTAQRGLTIIDSIRINNPCARVFLYEISNGVISQNDYPTYFATQTKIKDSITKLADLMHLPLIPAGECFRSHYTTSPDLLLHNSYGDVHPNPNGSYLVACAAYVTIYEDSVTSTTQYAGIPNTTAEYLQDIADQVVLSNKPSWRIDTFEPQAEFSFNQTGSVVNFSNTSVNYDSLSWNFGDGITSSETNPQHEYLANGNYTVTLTIYQHGCEYTFQEQVVISELGLQEISAHDVKLYPNPAKDLLTLSSGSNIERVVLTDLHGKLVSCYNTYSSLATIDIFDLPSGIYFVKVTGNAIAATIRFEKL